MRRIETRRPLLWGLKAFMGAVMAATAPTVAAQVSAQLCGALASQGQFGPYDYRTDKYYLPVVQDRHFTPRIESLINVKGQNLYGGDIDYTLRKFPNHHRALMSVLRVAERKIPPQVHGLLLPPECYFERAVRWRADDPVPRMLYARFLGQEKRFDEARQMLEATERIAGDNVLTRRNIGLVYLEIGMPDKALEQAHRVMQIDPAETALKLALQGKGQWREPTPQESGDLAALDAKAPAAASSAASGAQQ